MKKIRCHVWYLFILLLLSMNIACSRNDVLLEDLDWERFLKQHDMYWTTLTADPVEPTNDAKLQTGYYAGAIMGNGLLGTNLYKLRDSVYRLNVGRSDVKEMRKPYNLFNSARLPIGYFTLSTVGQVQKEEMRLSLYNAMTEGTLVSDCGSLKFSTFVHALKNYIVFQTDAQGKETGFTWNFVPQKAVSPRYVLRNSSVTPDYLNHQGDANPPVEARVDNNTHYSIQKLVTDSTMSHVAKVYVVAWREIDEGSKRTLLATVSLEDTEELAIQQAKRTLDDAESQSYHDLVVSHKEWWNSFYQNAAFLTFPDTRFESFYWAQYYKFASTTRPDKPIVDLQGVWPTWDTPWTAVWINLNLQLTYSWQTKANLGWLAEPLWSSLYEHRDNLRRNVTDIPSQRTWTDAACLGRTSSYDFLASLNPDLVKSNQYEVGNLTWLLFYYWQYCEAYGETEQLTQKLFPLLKAAVNLFFHIRIEENGQYSLPPTASPEYISTNIGSNSNYDLANLRWGLKTLIDIDTRYQLNDPLLPQWKDFLEHLVDYPYDEETGYKVSDLYRFENTSHRHYSHLFMIYPYYMVNWGQVENREKIRLSVERWQGNQGYSRTGKTSMLLSMGKGDEALDQMNKFLDRFVKPNTLYAETGPVIETPLAAISSLHDFYMQDWGGVIRIFHGIPMEWKDAAFVRMRALGAFLVSATRSQGHTVYIQLESEKGNVCKIQTGIPVANLLVRSKSGKDVEYKVIDEEYGIIEFPTGIGDVIEITDKTQKVVKPAPLPHPDEETLYYGDGLHGQRK